MATMMKQSVSVRAAAPARRSAVVVRASAEPVDRRAALGFIAAAFTAAVAPQAQAIGLPWQESTGGLVKGKGSMPKSSTAASMEGYTLEGYPGTKKPSFIEPSKKKKLLAKARANAEKIAK